MGTVKKVYGIKGKVERMFVRLMRYNLYCLGRILPPTCVLSPELSESDYFLLIILVLFYLV